MEEHEKRRQRDADLAREFDERVAALSAWTFDMAAYDIAKAMATGRGLSMAFQPGDATRYLIDVGVRRLLTYSSPEVGEVIGETDETLRSLSSVTIGFRVGDRASTDSAPWGHIDLLRPAHPWTAAVWRRLLDRIRRELEE